MDPNPNTNQLPNEPVQPTNAPEPVIPAPSPVPQAAPPQPATIAPPAPVSYNTVNNKSKMGLIIAAVVGVLLFAIASALAWLYFFSPAAQAKKASTAFMKAATTNDTEELYKLTDSTDESAKKFLNSAAESSSGSFKLKESAMKDGAGYFLYDLTSEKAKQARTIVKKKDGKWQVDSYVFGSSVALIPGSSADQAAAPKDDTPQQTEIPTTTVVCLEDTDLKTLNNSKPEDEGFGTTFTTEGYRQYIGHTYFFQADSTQYVYPTQIAEEFTRVETFYKANSGKKFAFHLKGKVKESSASSSGAKLANERATKIKNDLIARGVPADRIVIDEPQTSSASYSDGSERNVDLTVRKPLDCTSPDTTQTGR